MITFKLIRKIGKILRGGAGRKEIILGTLFGVLIGFNPGVSFSLVLTLLLALLLNANFSFVVLGAAVGKLLSLTTAAVSFHIGYVIIHNLGMEDLFRALSNAPVTALMDLNVYAMVGSLPLALIIGIVLGSALGAAVLKIRSKMLEADQHEIVGKAFGNKVSRLLLRLAFGKSKLSLEDEIPKQAPWLRKSGLILVIVMIVIAGLLEFLLLDSVIRKTIVSSIEASTGAEVNLKTAHLSLAQGELTVEGLQITDPDKPTHNMIQIDKLAADIDIGELLSRNYAIDLLAVSVLEKDVPRAAPGKVYPKKEKEAAAPGQDEDPSGVPIDEYFAKAGKWKEYGQKAYEYLKERKENAEQRAADTKPEPDKAKALADAEALGYLKASADLVADRPAWLVREIRVEKVELGNNIPEQILLASEVSSHPEINGKPTSITLMPVDSAEPTAKIVLRFDDPAAPHAVQIKMSGISIGESIETSESFPVDIRDGMADLHAAGTFSVDTLDVPFTLLLRELKADVEEGETVMGMDSATATEVLSSMEQLNIEGALGGSLLQPRVSIDYDKLTANMKDALIAAGKEELANRANAEMDKAKEELKAQAGEELKKALGGEEGASVENQAKDALKKLF